MRIYVRRLAWSHAYNAWMEGTHAWLNKNRTRLRGTHAHHANRRGHNVRRERRGSHVRRVRVRMLMLRVRVLGMRMVRNMNNTNRHATRGLKGRTLMRRTSMNHNRRVHILNVTLVWSSHAKPKRRSVF